MKMKPKKSAFFIVFLLSCLCSLSGFAQTQEFSADIISRGPDGTQSGKVFSTPNKSRMEAGGVITIARLDQNLAWVLMSKDKVYMETSLPASAVTAGGGRMVGEIERKLVGKETIDGKAADKYRIVYTNAGKPETIYSWIISGSDIPVKTAAQDGSWQVEYKNIKTGKQPDSLFEVPSGYSKFAMPSMKDIMGAAMEDLPGQFNN
jgi:hypothetical protein